MQNENEVDGYNYRTKRVCFRKQLKLKALARYMKSILLLALVGTFAAVAEFPISYDPRPEPGGLPPSSEWQQQKPVTNAPATLAAALGDSVLSITIRYYRDCWKTPEDARKYLAGLLRDQKNEVKIAPVWAQPVMWPHLECFIQYKNGFRGKLLLWDWVGCVQDAERRWWFVTFPDYFKANHPEKR